MKKYFLLLAISISLFYLSQNTEAAVYGSGQSCYYGALCAQQGYSTPGEVYCSDWFAYVDANGNQVCTYGTKCCGSDPYCTSVLGGTPYPVPSSCSPASCYYNSQQTCTGGRICGSSGCVCPSGTTWDSISGSCKSPTTSTCTAANLIISSTGTGTCTVAGSVINAGTGCSGQTFVIKDSSGTTKCTGIISGTSGSCPSTWSISADTTYNLFIPSGSATPVDTKTASCGTPCSSYSAQSSCQSGGCYWCASPNTPGNTCVQSSSQCTTGCNNNGIQDNGETGVDCGGGGCSACIACEGSCGWISPWTGLCSTGCPISYPNQQWVCVPGLPGGCGGRSGCASYDPTKGETPCSPSCGTFYVCDKQSVCTTTGCKNICTDPSFPKSGDAYCSKCNSCQDGIKNCGETSVDKGGPNCGQPCTVPTVKSFTASGNGGFSCSPYGTQYCVGQAPSGYYNVQCVNPISCNSGSYGCVYQCQGTNNDFNVASCSDGVQNCGETCVDGGPQCASYFGKETDNSYLVTFDYSEPSGLSGTIFYTDAAAWNCADGIDNNKNCLTDCADPNCYGKTIACQAYPTVGVSFAPNPPCTGDPKTSWIDCAASASVTCSSAVGCNPYSYGLASFTSDPGTCPTSKSSYNSQSLQITDHKWVCAYAEDTSGNSGVSAPAEAKVNRTFTIAVNAKAYGDIDVPAGTQVKAYLCEPSQYYCNQDAKYLASGSAVVGADKKFTITFVRALERGQRYKIGVVTEKGYAESEFTA